VSHEDVVVVGSAFHKEAYVDKNQEVEEEEEHMENRKGQEEDPKEPELLNREDLAVAHQGDTVEEDRHQAAGLKEDKLDLVVELLGVQEAAAVYLRS